jgi:hypothetical protein
MGIDDALRRIHMASGYTLHCMELQVYTTSRSLSSVSNFDRSNAQGVP